MLGTILLVILILLVIGALPTWGRGGRLAGLGSMSMIRLSPASFQRARSPAISRESGRS